MKKVIKFIIIVIIIFGIIGCTKNETKTENNGATKEENIQKVS